MWNGSPGISLEVSFLNMINVIHERYPKLSKLYHGNDINEVDLYKINWIPFSKYYLKKDLSEQFNELFMQTNLFDAIFNYLFIYAMNEFDTKNFDNIRFFLTQLFEKSDDDPVKLGKTISEMIKNIKIPSMAKQHSNLNISINMTNNIIDMFSRSIPTAELIENILTNLKDDISNLKNSIPNERLILKFYISLLNNVIHLKGTNSIYNNNHLGPVEKYLTITKKEHHNVFQNLLIQNFEKGLELIRNDRHLINISDSFFELDKLEIVRQFIGDTYIKLSMYDIDKYYYNLVSTILLTSPKIREYLLPINDLDVIQKMLMIEKLTDGEKLWSN
jgi:hypothetical protein